MYMGVKKIVWGGQILAFFNIKYRGSNFGHFYIGGQILSIFCMGSIFSIFLYRGSHFGRFCKGVNRSKLVVFYTLPLWVAGYRYAVERLESRGWRPMGSRVLTCTFSSLSTAFTLHPGRNELFLTWSPDI